MQFRNINDARLYINNSFIKYYKNSAPETILYGFVTGVEDRTQPDGSIEPCMRIARLGENGLSSRAWRSLEQYTVPPQSFRLGNVQTGSVVSYIQRIPVRRASMGLNSGNTFMTQIGEPDPEARYVDFNSLICDYSFVRALGDEYPTVQEAFDSRTPMAFSRCFSFEPIGLLVKRLYYRGETVGEATSDSFVIYEPFAWVADTLGRTLAKKGVQDDFNIRVAS